MINVTDPTLAFCPLASHLYKGLRDNAGLDKESVKREIKKVIEAKIKTSGFFTAKRKLLCSERVIPYGASEMLMFALRKKFVDAAVIVCDGAGSVIASDGRVVQGIGARMNSLLLTSPIEETIKRLKELGCQVVFDHALIDQAQGVKEAIRHGYKKIAVTVSGHDAEKLKEIRHWETSRGVAITILVVCTTGISGAKTDEIRRYADIVWSCASLDIRQKIGAIALLQISKQIPVFVLTQRGIDFFKSTVDDGAFLKDLDRTRQYLISHERGNHKIKMGSLIGYLREANLPILSGKSFAMANS